MALAADESWVMVNGFTGLLGHAVNHICSRCTDHIRQACYGEVSYVAATFGLLSLDLLTTTGMRANELLQLNLSSNCIVQLVDDSPPGAKDPSPRIRYVLRLLPKGNGRRRATIMELARNRSI